MKSFRILILPFVAFASFTGCMTSPRNSKESVEATALRNRRSAVLTEIKDIDSQLSTIDGMIAASDARVQSYQGSGNAGKESQITGNEAESRNYESEKQSLISRKRKLELELISIH